MEYDMNGGVMGHVANSENVPTRVSFNFDREARKGSSLGENAVPQDDFMRSVMKAASCCDVQTMDRLVKRDMWGLDQ